MLVIYVPWLQRIFQTEALSLSDLAYIIVVTSSIVVLDTARKVLFPDRQESQVGSFHLKALLAIFSALSLHRHPS